jgi:hypothetical protein
METSSSSSPALRDTGKSLNNCSPGHCFVAIAVRTNGNA